MRAKTSLLAHVERTSLARPGRASARLLSQPHLGHWLEYGREASSHRERQLPRGQGPKAGGASPAG
jgi:hypothetical protein